MSRMTVETMSGVWLNKQEDNSFLQSSRSIDKRLTEALFKKNIPSITLDTDEDGHAIIDKNKNPEIYDWLVNG